MADLSQDPKPTPPPEANIPANPPAATDQPSTESPGDPPSSPPESFKPEEVKEKLSSLGIKTPKTETKEPSEPKSKKGKLIAAALVLLLALISLPAGVYLVRQRQELETRADPGVTGDMTCLPDINLGPGNYSFAANGAGLLDVPSARVGVTIPDGATPLVDHTYAYWSGEDKGDTANGQISINGQILTGQRIYKKHNPDWGGYSHIFRVKVPSDLVSGPKVTLNFGGFDLPQGSSEPERGGAHGVSVVVPYEKADLPISKIIIRSCGDMVYHGNREDNWSDPITFNFPDISPAGAPLKAAFFFGEGEGPRPNHFHYNDNRLAITDGTSFPAASSDRGNWWDTRITGDDLQAINASGNSATFKALSPRREGDRNGDSFYLIGGTLQYPVTAPPECGDGNLDPDEECDPPGCVGDGEACPNGDECCSGDCVAGVCENTSCSSGGTCTNACVCPEISYQLTCNQLRAYDGDGNEITASLSDLSIGETVRFVVTGVTDHPDGVVKARFTINDSVDSAWCTGTGNTETADGCETTNVGANEGEFYLDYQIPNAGHFKIEAMVYNPDLDWQ